VFTGEALTAKEGWLDGPVRLHSGMVHWPDNPPVEIERMLDIDRGDAAIVSKISMDSHTGTHMDASEVTSASRANSGQGVANRVFLLPARLGKGA
jgi:hypothetical protein